MRLRGQSLTTLLVGLIALSYLIELLIPGYQEALWISGFDYQEGEYWRLITVALVHGGFFHLGFNLYALHILGTPVELYFGRNKYVLILLTSLILGSLASALFQDRLKTERQPTVRIRQEKLKFCKKDIRPYAKDLQTQNRITCDSCLIPNF